MTSHKSLKSVYIRMNQTISYALITAVCLGMFLTAIPSVIKAFREAENIIERRSVLTIRSAIDEAIALSLGEEGGEVKVLIPVRVHISCSGDVVLLSSGGAVDRLELPFRVSCASSDLRGCLIIRSMWSREEVVLSWRGC